MRSALVVLFNQDFSKNIPKLEAIYRDRFDKILYVVPDHCSRFHSAYVRGWAPTSWVRGLDRLCNRIRRLWGRRNLFELSECDPSYPSGRVVRVVGDQYFFYDYLTQAAERLLELDVSWFWVVGDDALLHPSLDGYRLHQRFSLDSGHDCVLCRPVIGSDHWVSRIAGSVESARAKLEHALRATLPLTGKPPIEPEPGAEHNKVVPVACFDFLGVRRDIFQRVLPIWRRCLDQKLYVEIGGPNGLLAVAESPVFIDQFMWTRDVSPERWRQMAVELRKSEAVFSHPIKLSKAPMDEVPILRDGAMGSVVAD